jgi:pyruvate/2-oxoglutarate dehydrogenase complex dihydrolipoamide dehydrogenase (E3) component
MANQTSQRISLEMLASLSRTRLFSPARSPLRAADQTVQERTQAMTEIAADICVIGAGTGGLGVASAAARLGRKVVLVEKAVMGGNALNAGCIPSKALIAAARSAELKRAGREFGVSPASVEVDAVRLREHIREIASEIAPRDSQARYDELGVTVLREPARFLDRKTVQVGDARIAAKRYVIATGSRPAIPELEGLDQVPYFTTATIFEKDFVPPHLIVLGGGSSGIELAQAHRRLGAEVTVIDNARLLARYDRELAQILFDRLTREGIVLREGAKLSRVERSSAGVRVEIARVQGHEVIEGSHLLVATGRTPNVEGLDLEKAGIRLDENGIKVDAGLRTSNYRVYAIGDAAGAPQFTHVAAWQAGLVVRNLLFKQHVHTSYDAVPTVLHSDPEIASVGLSPSDAKKRRLNFDVVTATLSDTDRGKSDRVGESLIQAVVGKKGHVHGVSIVATNAGELILPWLIVVSQQIPLSRLADLVVPYPTLGEHMKNLVASYYNSALINRHGPSLEGILARMR